MSAQHGLVLGLRRSIDVEVFSLPQGAGLVRLVAAYLILRVYACLLLGGYYMCMHFIRDLDKHLRSRILQVHYCSKEHQKTHWKQHQSECKRLGSGSGSVAGAGYGALVSPPPNSVAYRSCQGPSLCQPSYPLSPPLYH